MRLRKTKSDVWDLEVADVDVGGDVHRIVLSGIKNPAEACAHASREKIFNEYDALRKLLITYPYGHEDMCADFIFDSDHAEASHGYVIMESMGYPYYSGSNTIATVAALIEYSIIPTREGISEITLDAPGGIVKAQYHIENDTIKDVTVNGGAAYVIKAEDSIHVPGIGTIPFALVWSGAYFIMVDADALGITLTRDDISRMKYIGHALIETLTKSFAYEHHDYGNIDPPGFVHFMGRWEKTGDKAYKGRGATYGHPSTIYYCPTGTGTSARMALMALQGHIEPDATFESISAMDNIFTGKGLGNTKIHAYTALETNITARPFVLATTCMHIDFDNPVMSDFSKLRDIISQH